MFNATEMRVRARKKSRLDSYFKRIGFRDILNGLVNDAVPEEKIMKSSRGVHGHTMLHDAFFMDFMQWIGGETYYRSVKKFVTFKGNE